MSKPTSKPYILVVEDEDSISMMVRYNLEKEGFEVKIVEEGDTALWEIEERRPDLVILDWMIPEINGVQVCRKMREKIDMQDIPVIMLTARGEESDRLQGLDSGADDYIIKPFSPKELVARIRAVLRRTRPSLESQKLEFGGILVNLIEHRAEYQGKIMKLGPTEFRLLCYLLEHPRRVFTREHLLSAVWGQDGTLETRTVDVHIRRLRKALSNVSLGLEELICTVRSAGYKIDDTVDA